MYVYHYIPGAREHPVEALPRTDQVLDLLGHLLEEDPVYIYIYGEREREIYIYMYIYIYI